MRKFISIIAVVMLVAFAACEKEKVEVFVDQPSEIPGMGNADGQLQVDAYSFPADIELVGAIQGLTNDASVGSVADASDRNLKSAQTYSCYGSGGKYVKVQLTLRNTSNMKRTVFLPRGLVFEVNQAGYQHAMLMQWTWVCINPQAEKTFVLDLYCINRGLPGSGSNTQFSIIGITNSDLMWSLLRMIGWRKINVEHYEVVGTSATLKSSNGEVLDYENIVFNIQEAVWSLTNDSGLTDDQVNFIKSIPMLEEGTYPEGLDDKTVEPPYYFDEYTPVQ